MSSTSLGRRWAPPPLTHPPTARGAGTACAFDPLGLISLSLFPLHRPRSPLHRKTTMGNVPSGVLAQAAPIHEAAAMDNVGKLRALLAEGESVDAVDKVRLSDNACF